MLITERETPITLRIMDASTCEGQTKKWATRKTTLRVRSARPILGPWKVVEASSFDVAGEGQKSRLVKKVYYY